MIAFVVLGLLTGLLSGVVGIGGGVVLVPALVYIFHFSQQTAQGTTLALLIPPIGIFAAMTYYKAGHVNIRVAAFIIIGFVIGSLLGAKFAMHVPTQLLTRLFGAFLMIVGFRMLLYR